MKTNKMVYLEMQTIKEINQFISWAKNHHNEELNFSKIIEIMWQTEKEELTARYGDIFSRK